MTMEVDLRRCAPALIAFSGFAFVFRAALFNWLPRGSTFAQELELIHLLGQLAGTGLLLAYLRRQLPWWGGLYLLALSVGYALFGLATGVIAEAVFSLAPLFFVYVWERGRLPWGAMVGCVLVLAPLQAAKGDFRKKTWEGGREVQNSMGLVQRLRLLGDTLEEAADRGNLSAESVSESDSERTNYLGTLAVVIDATPRRVPYWEGGTYSDFLWHFVPRFVAPDKPARSMGQEFPRRYQLIDAEDETTAYNLAQLVELYINYGWAGVVLGMAIIALIYALLDHVFSGCSAGALIGGQIIAALINIEGDFNSVFGGLPLLAIALYVFVRFLPRERGGDARAGEHAPNALLQRA
jgi:hypothetical protein